MQPEHSQPLRVLSVEPDPLGGPDNMADWAREAGVELQRLMPYQQTLEPEMVRDFDALIVFGGNMGDMDTDQYPWLENIRETCRVANQEGIPTLGICLGSQLLAASLGGKVDRGGAGLETGAIEVSVREEGRNDPLLGTLPDDFTVGAMHSDAIEQLPPGATWIASSEQYPHQAFRVRESWGVQFHPEVSPAGYERWVDYVLKDDPEDTNDLRGTVKVFNETYAEVRPVCARLFKNFFAYASRGE